MKKNPMEILELNTITLCVMLSEQAQQQNIGDRGKKNSELEGK